MTYARPDVALRQYRQTGLTGSLETASPHRLVELLLQGALDRINTARGCLQRGDLAGKARMVGAAMSIVDELRGSLNFEAGGTLAENLNALYDYVQRQLVVANARNDAGSFDEVSAILGEIKSAWDSVRDAAMPQRPR